MTFYQKLVRDRIPEMIQQKGQVCVVRTLDQEAFRQALLEKLCEEAEEVRKACGDREEFLKELADVHEVLETILTAYDLPSSELKRIQTEKRDRRGGFEKRLFLESVE